MFKRVIFEDWAYYIPFIAFFIFFVVFVVITIRALRLEKSERTRLASLPLESNSETPNPETP
jgi:hypothetical protein